MSPSGNPGPPPVTRSAVAPAPATGRELAPSERNYLTITETLRKNNGAEARAIRAMFGGNKLLMDRFLSVAFSLLAADSDLLTRATPMSIIEAIKKAASLGLEPMTDEAAIVRYDNRAQLLPMYKGYLKRIRNSGTMKVVDVGTVYANDEFDYGATEQGPWWTHHPAKLKKDPETGEVLSERGGYQGFYAYAIENNGERHFRYMDVDEINYIRDQFGRTHSRDGKPLPWATRYEQMALKTVLRQLQKMLPQEAVGREFLELEKQNDEAMEQIDRKVDDLMGEVRNLALAAVGAVPQLPAGTEEGQSSDGQGGADPEDSAGAEGTLEPTEPEQPAEPLADPGADPNVAAAMAVASEQDELERLRRFRERQR